MISTVQENKDQFLSLLKLNLAKIRSGTDQVQLTN